MTVRFLPLAACPSLPGTGPVGDAAWLQAWSAAFRADARLLMTADGAAWMPLLRQSRGPANLLRTLCSPTNGHSQYAGLVLSPDDPEGSAKALLRAATGLAGWDFLRLQGVPLADCAPLHRAAETLGLRLQIERRFPHHVADLAAVRAGALPPPMSGATRRRKDRQLRALERIGTVGFTRACGPDRPAALEDYLRAERLSWKSAGGELLSASPAIGGFYRAVAMMPGTEIWSMLLEGRPIAGMILRRAAGELVCLKTFFDSALDPHSPGSLLAIAILRHHLQDPAPARMNFYSGKDSYRFLATGQLQLCDLIIWGRGARPALLRRGRGLLHRLRAARAPAVPDHDEGP